MVTVQTSAIKHMGRRPGSGRRACVCNASKHSFQTSDSVVAAEDSRRIARVLKGFDDIKQYKASVVCLPYITITLSSQCR